MSRPPTSWGLAALLLGCQSLDRFDTKQGSAYCGAIESSQFIWTPAPPLEPPCPTSPPAEGGFDRRLRMRLELDTNQLQTADPAHPPGKITTDDTDLCPCAPKATFEEAPLRIVPEVARDSLSLMTFEEGQVRNIIAWVDSTCRGPMLAIVSLYNTDRVDVRLMKAAPSNATDHRDAFALFPLDRREAGCGF
jgi:hypothetical protein